MIEMQLNELRMDYTVHARDMGPYAVLKKSGMTFRIASYEVKGLGSASTILDIRKNKPALL